MFRNVVAIVTGGSSGLGAATASYIVRHGGRVVVADLPSSKEQYLRLAAMTCAEVHQNTSSAYAKETNLSNDNNSNSSNPIMAFAETNVTDENDVKNALDFAQDTFGRSVNVAVSCAGIGVARKTISSSSKSSSLRIHSLDEFSKALQVNTMGTFNVARLAAERMAENEPDVNGLRGCIVNTASIAAFEGQTGQVAYAASKGAVVGTFSVFCLVLSNYVVVVVVIM